MPLRGPSCRFLFVVPLLVVAVLVVAGGLELGGPGLLAVTVAGVLVGGTCAGMARELPHRVDRSALEVGVLSAAATIVGLFALTGVVVLFGGAAAGVIVVAGLAAGVGYVMLHQQRPATAGGAVPVLGVPSLSGRTGGGTAGRQPARPLAPVTSLSIEELGREWVLSTAALGVRLEPGTRQSIVHRRQAALDELERRDPIGFARWLASGPRPGSDPADYVRGRPPADTDAA